MYDILGVRGVGAWRSPKVKPAQEAGASSLATHLMHRLMEKRASKRPSVRDPALLMIKESSSVCSKGASCRPA
eukprot:5268033-Amphidinium_carterae.1